MALYKFRIIIIIIIIIASSEMFRIVILIETRLCDMAVTQK